MHDPITEELFRNAIVALGDEMALTIYRTAYSGVLKNIMGMWPIQRARF